MCPLKTTLQRPVDEFIKTSDRKLRVLMYLYFPAGGIGRYTAKLMPELTALGATVEAAVVPEFEWQDAPGFSAWPNLKSISHPNAIRRKARFLVGQFVNPWRLAARARDTKPDIIHICNINHLSYPLWERAFPSEGPLLAATVHDVQRQKGILYKPWEAWQLRRFYRRANVLFVHSQEQVRELERFAGIDPGKVRIVPHGPYSYPRANETRSETRHRLGIPSDSILGLSFGLIRDEKNIDRLIQALTTQPQNVHLLVAGSGVSGHRSVEHYRTVAERAVVQERVHFREGHVPDEEVGSLFQASDWIALTYSKSFTSQSGVLNSAVHFRKPIIATPTPAFSENLTRFKIGLLCSDDSVSSISAALDEFRTRDTSSLDYEAYMVANSWLKNAQITLDAYSEVTVR